MYKRTYIIKFTTPNGDRFYAGKRKSNYINPYDDPYKGSGVYPKRVIKKYGTECVSGIIWFNHDTNEEMNDHEITLVNLLHSSNLTCVNIANGGEGGNVMKYASEEKIRSMLFLDPQSLPLSLRNIIENLKISRLYLIEIRNIITPQKIEKIIVNL